MFDGGVTVHISEVAEDYIIVENENKFAVRRTVSDCDDIGPFTCFKDAEDIVVKIGICLTQYEEGLWKVLAAQAIKVAPVFDGTANQVEDTAP